MPSPVRYAVILAARQGIRLGGDAAQEVLSAGKWTEGTQT